MKEQASAREKAKRLRVVWPRWNESLCEGRWWVPVLQRKRRVAGEWEVWWAIRSRRRQSASGVEYERMTTGGGGQRVWQKGGWVMRCSAHNDVQSDRAAQQETEEEEQEEDSKRTQEEPLNKLLHEICSVDGRCRQHKSVARSLQPEGGVVRPLLGNIRKCTCLNIPPCSGVSLFFSLHCCNRYAPAHDRGTRTSRCFISGLQLSFLWHKAVLFVV